MKWYLIVIYICIALLRWYDTPLQYSCLENPMDGGAWWAAVHGVARSQTRLRDFTLTFHFHALEKEMATHSSVLAWRIPGTGEPGGLPSLGSHRVGHDWSDLAAAAVAAQRLKRQSTMRETWGRSRGWEVPWRRKRQPTPVLLPRESHGWMSLMSMGSQRVGHNWATSLSLQWLGIRRIFPVIKYLYIIFREVSIQVLCQVLYWTVCLFVVESLFTLLILSFAAYFLILMKSDLFIFPFVSLLVW